MKNTKKTPLLLMLCLDKRTPQSKIYLLKEISHNLVCSTKSVIEETSCIKLR